MFSYACDRCGRDLGPSGNHYRWTDNNGTTVYDLCGNCSMAVRTFITTPPPQLSQKRGNDK